ncbi:hypothetical protein ACTGJ9_022350 [Bradyrhizobium sp. RDM12]
MIILTKKYQNSSAMLSRFAESGRLPNPVLGAVKDFDRAIADNVSIMQNVLNDSLQESRQFFLQGENVNSPNYFGVINARFSDKFVQLKPKAEAVMTSVRAYLKVN